MACMTASALPMRRERSAWTEQGSSCRNRLGADARGGSVKAELALSQRIFKCDDCGYEAGRDLNAARSLENRTASFAVTACGEESSGAVRKPRVKRASMKQEEDNKITAEL